MDLNMSFRYENYMLQHLINYQVINNILLHKNKRTTIYYGCEVNNLFGIPDIVFTQYEDNKLICTCAIELKLSNWKKALTQAFRYKSFAELSYVILDNSNIMPALSNIYDFKKRNIGLLGLDEEGRLYQYYLPEFKEPYSKRLVYKINEMSIQRIGFCELVYN